MYRFGDLTPFPMSENFLDTLSAAVDCCAELYRLEGAVHEAEKLQRDAHIEAANDLRDLDALGRALGQSLEPFFDQVKNNQAIIATAEALLRRTSDCIRQSQAAVVARRTRAVDKARPAGVAERMERALGTLLVSSELPETQWFWNWRIDREQNATATLRALIGDDMEATFEAGAPAQPWNAAIDIEHIATGLHVSLPGKVKRGVLHTQDECLDGYEIVNVDRRRHRFRIVLRHIKGKRPGIAVSFRERGKDCPWAAHVDDAGEIVSQEVPIESEQLAALDPLREWVDEHARALIRSRSAMTSATLGEKIIETIDRPARLAEAILEMLAPLVRAIRMRSRVPGELTLRRDIEEGRREELFVSRERLCAKFADLPDHHRRTFEAMGLGAESTTDFRVRIARGTAAAGDTVTVPGNPTDVDPPTMPRARVLSDRKLVGHSPKTTVRADLAKVADLAKSLGLRENQGFSHVTERRDTSSGDQEGEAA